MNEMNNMLNPVEGIINPTPDYEAIKTRQNAAWASGDYSLVGVTLQLVGESLAESMLLPFGVPVLDVAGGNGNASLALARRGYNVTSSDYVAALLDRGAMRAEAEGLPMSFKVADAENLPFETGSFQGVISTFGVMFTPDQERSASELLRVCAPGGRIGLANWTEAGFIGQLFNTLGQYVPPAPGLSSPARWGGEAWLKTTFGPSASHIEITKKTFVFRYQSPEAFIETFRTIYGPVHKAFLALEPGQQDDLCKDMIKLIARFNQASDGSALIASDYVEVLIDRI